MSDDKDDTVELSGNAGGNGNRGTFNDLAAPPKPERGHDLTGTALEQKDLKADYEANLREHEQRLVALKHNFAAGNPNIPTYDLGPNAGRNLRRDYDLLFTRWQDQEVAINLKYASDRESIRDHGVTLVREFDRGNQQNNTNLKNKLSSVEGHLDVLTSFKPSVDALAHEIDIAKTQNLHDNKAVEKFDTRLSDLTQTFDNIESQIDYNDLAIDGEGVSLIDEWDFEKAHETIPHDVEIGMRFETDYRSQDNSSDVYSMENDHIDGLDFSPEDEFTANAEGWYEVESRSHADGDFCADDNGHDGGRSR